MSDKRNISLGSHDMFIADVVNVKADEKYLDSDTGKFDWLSQTYWFMHMGDIMKWAKKSVNSVGL